MSEDIQAPEPGAAVQDAVWVRATTSFGDVSVGDVFELAPDRAVALARYVEPVNLETFDVTQDSVPSTQVPLALGEPAVDFEEATDGESGRLPAEDEPVRSGADQA